MAQFHSFEELETRLSLAGDVTTYFSNGGLLTFQGDEAANHLSFENVNNGTQLRVTPLDGTTLNGQPIAKVFDSPRNGLSIDTGDGNDLIVLANLSVRGGLKLDSGAGDDILSFRKARIAGTTNLELGEGDDTTLFRMTTFQADARIDAGAGVDAITFSQSRFLNALALDAGSGKSNIRIGRSAFAGSVSITTGNTADHVAIDASGFSQAASVHTRGGNDRIFVRGTSFRESADMDDGKGNDVVDREVLLSWNFANGAQGWGGGFSDYSPSTVNPTDDGVSRFEFINKIAPLPADLGLNQTGYEFSAKNLSADLFAFLTRPVTADDGIIGGVSYDVTFDIQFASNVPTGLGGIGGPPAEAVFFKVGGTTQRPKTYLDDQGDIVIDLNKNGVDMSGAGDIRNGEVFGPGDSLIDSEKRKYKLVRRVKTHDNPVLSDKTGRLWLIFGTDSGFEGRTTLYYASVAIRLTPSASHGI